MKITITGMGMGMPEEQDSFQSETNNMSRCDWVGRGSTASYPTGEWAGGANSNSAHGSSDIVGPASPFDKGNHSK